MTRKRIVRIITFVLLAALVVAALIFTRPMTLEEIYPGMDWEDLDEVSVYSRKNRRADTGKAHKVFDHYYYNADLTGEDELTQELAELLRAQTFRRKLSSFLPQGARTHATEDGDFEWSVRFYSRGEDEWSMSDIYLESWYGELSSSGSDRELYFDGPYINKDYDLATDKDFADKVFALITAHIEPTINYYGD